MGAMHVRPRELKKDPLPLQNPHSLGHRQMSESCLRRFLVHAELTNKSSEFSFGPHLSLPPKNSVDKNALSFRNFYVQFPLRHSE